MAAINGVASNPAAIENRPVQPQEERGAKDNERIEQNKSDDAVVSNVQSRDTQPLRDPGEAQATALGAADKIRSLGISAVDSHKPRAPEDVQQLIA